MVNSHFKWEHSRARIVEENWLQISVEFDYVIASMYVCVCVCVCVCIEHCMLHSRHSWSVAHHRHVWILALLDIEFRAFAVCLLHRMDAFRSLQLLKLSTGIVEHHVLQVLLFETNNTKCMYFFKNTKVSPRKKNKENVLMLFSYLFGHVYHFSNW